MSTATHGELITRWIEPNPHKPGPAEAWVLPRCVSVWAAVRQLELEGGQSERVAEVYDTSVEAIEAAVAYCRQHRRVIDAHIRKNRAFFGV